jgi:hypothetical protein
MMLQRHAVATWFVDCCLERRQSIVEWAEQHRRAHQTAAQPSTSFFHQPNWDAMISLSPVPVAVNVSFQPVNSTPRTGEDR